MDEQLRPICGRSFEPIGCERCSEPTNRWWRDTGVRLCPACKSREW